jgi:hypothetical protein
MYRDIRRILKGVDTDDLSIELSEFVVKIMKRKCYKVRKNNRKRQISYR